MNKHTLGDLYQMQSLPLKYKIIMTQQRIRSWYDHFGGEVYVAFSGGKDSTVLVDIIDKMGYTDIPLVFADTGLEYPEIREFVKGYGDRVTWLRPKMTFKQVIEKYGYPFISKEVSECVAGARQCLGSILDEDISKIDIEKNEQLAEALRANKGKKSTMRTAALLGMVTKNNEIKANVGTKDKSTYSKRKYEFFLKAPFEISKACCDVMKKEPSHRYSKETGRVQITAQMASESRLRTTKWLMYGCNGFDMKAPTSNPMSFWTEQDVLLYIKQNNLPICSVYGEIIEDLTDTEEVEGQLTMSDVEGWEEQGMFDAKRLPLKTTGCSRTGCMFCGFGCHLEKGEGRFEMMKRTHPKQYDYIMRPWSEGGA